MSKKKHKSEAKHRLICVRWRDHMSLDDWIEEKDIKKKLQAHEMLSVGWLIDEDGDAYYLAGTLDSKGKSVGDARCILKGAVMKIIDIGNE